MRRGSRREGLLHSPDERKLHEAHGQDRPGRAGGHHHSNERRMSPRCVCHGLGTGFKGGPRCRTMKRSCQNCLRRNHSRSFPFAEVSLRGAHCTHDLQGNGPMPSPPVTEAGFDSSPRRGVTPRTRRAKAACNTLPALRLPATGTSPSEHARRRGPCLGSTPPRLPGRPVSGFPGLSDGAQAFHLSGSGQKDPSEKPAG